MNRQLHAAEVSSGQRFEFGANWSKFLERLDERRIVRAEASLLDMLGVAHLKGKRFLDIGSGSGLFSLAARRLGAEVVSFDYDPNSVACTNELRRLHFGNDPAWIVNEASVLDEDHLQRLPASDVVYSWGVIHHTGAMQVGLANIAPLVRPDGKLFIAIYNDQGRPSRSWLKVKQAYNRLPTFLRWLVLVPAFVRLWGPTTIRDVLRGKPFHTWRHYSDFSTRGMDPWRDVVDWVGGLPFEVAKPEEILDFYRSRGFRLDRLRTCAGGHGCNEFVFTRVDQ